MEQHAGNQHSLFKRNWVRGSAVLATAALSLALATPAQAAPLTGVKDVKASDNVVTVTFAQGDGEVQGKITFLEEDIFRYNVDPAGEFGEYAKPRSEKHAAKIQAQPDSSDKYSHPQAKVDAQGGKFVITAGKTTIEFDKATALMTVKRGDKVVMEEKAALDLDKSATVQTLAKHDGENFFGGGTQNGRFIHTGNTINIANESNWVDGGVASPNPFYWSDAGYGVLRNTFQDGSYDFGATEASTTTARHNENELDAYYFVADASKGASTAPVAQDLLQDYFQVTGNPVLLPEYAFYVGHLNAWNRDMWSAEAKGGYGKKQIKGSEPASDPNAGEVQYEKGGTGTAMQPDTHVESLNGHGPTVHNENIPAGTDFPEEFSARHRLDSYVNNDMPLGYFLPNDGYGAGYGQNGFGKTGGVNPDGTSSQERLDAVAANVQNLKEFSDYAAGKGVATGLWTQSYLTPDSNANTQWQLLRDFDAEVKKGGVTTLKTDVAWVGPGYSMALDGTKTAYDIVTEGVNKRPNIITLDGWAGTQRFAGIWTGDQYGGNWEYIRFHIPTYIGQSLSGNPNIGSDMDGIFGGDPIIATRDYQWKTFTPLMLDMDGWGSYVKAPQTHGDPYTGISRMYLKLKSSLMPYLYTTAASAANIDTGNGDTGLPMVRAILLSDDSAYAQSTATQYEYTFGDSFLVAPVYQNTDGDAANKGLGDGNDVRNNIYLPGTSEDIWIDYFTGDQYRGGQVLNNFEAPLWKLPLFVKANAIVPMYEPNDNPADIDRTKRNIEFFATAGDGSYTLFEDTGTYVENKTDTSNAEYGKEDNVSYGSSVKTTFTSHVEGDTATFTAGTSEGTYEGYNSNRTTEFTVNVSAEPKSVVAKNGKTELKVEKVDTLDKFKKAEPKDGTAVYFFEQTPNLNYNATAESEQVRGEEFSKQAINTTPKLHVKFAKTDVNKTEQTLEVKGFVNAGELSGDTLNESLKAPTNLAAPEDSLTPTSIKLTWDKVEGATSYDIEIDGMVNSIPGGDTVEFTVADLPYHSSHEFKIRTRTQEGYSAWSEPITVQTLEDPWRNAPKPVHVDWEGGEKWGKLDLAFDHDDKSDKNFHSSNANEAIGMPMTIDYGKTFAFDKFVYTPRQDNGGNGNVAQMKVETSLDGVHWKDFGVQEWDNAGADKMKPKTVGLQGVMGRYLRLTPLKSTGGFFSATELALYKTEASKMGHPGSIKVHGDEVTSADYEHLRGNCLGRENRGTGQADWTSHIGSNGADFNMNDAFDVYDMSFTMSALDGGTTKKGKVEGAIDVIPSATSWKAGDVITIDVYASNAKNVNAFGALVHFDSSMFEYVKGGLYQNPMTAGMEDLTGEDVYTFGDGTDSVNLAFANRGDKSLYNGTGSLVSFQLKAKRDGSLQTKAASGALLDSTAWLVGPTCDFKESKSSESGVLPEAPGETKMEYGKDAFASMTLTNDILTTDDGSNASKMLQNGNFDPLFDGNENAGQFEFKWDTAQNHIDGALPAYVKLPTDMTFTFKEPSALTSVDILNRENGNGSVNSLRAVINFEGGDKQEFSFDAKQPVYTLTVDDAHKGKKATSVVITPLTADGTAGTNPNEQNKANRMLTLREINFNYSNPGVAAESIELDEKNAKEIYVGDLSVVNATVLPQDERYPYFTVESSDPAVASVVDRIDAEGKQTWYVRGQKAGTATITVSAKANPEVKATYEVTVKEGVDTSRLTEAIARAEKHSKDAYTPESYAKLTKAVEDARALIDSGEITKKDVANAVVAIDKAIDGLVMRPIDEVLLINKSAETDVKVVFATSEADNEGGLKECVLDYDNDTYWHSSYTDQAVLPDSLIFDLGAEYNLSDVTFLPRQNGRNGDIFKAEVFVGSSVEELKNGGTSLGVFEFENNGKQLIDRDQFKQMSFGAVPAQFVKVTAISAGGDNADLYASMSEIRFYGSRDEQPGAADVTALDKLVGDLKAEKLDPQAFTTESWKPFELALKDAEAMLANPPASDQQALVDDMVKRLDAARKGLVEKPVEPERPSKEELNALIDKALKVQTDGKSESVVAQFNAALANAQSVAKDDGATEAQIQDAYTRLNEALAKLEADQGNQGGGSGNQGGGSGNQGGGTGNQGGGSGNQGGGTGNQGGQTGGNQGGQTGGNNGQTGGNGGSDSTGNGGLPSTGDPALVAVAGTGVIGSALAAIGAFFRRKNRQ